MAKRRRSKPKPPAPSRRPVLVARHRAVLRASETFDLNRCERFLQHEARLLDEGKFDDWLALFTPDAWYWVPSEPVPLTTLAKLMALRNTCSGAPLSRKV